MVVIASTLEPSQLYSNGEANTAGYSGKTMLKSRSWQGWASTIFLEGFSQKLMEQSNIHGQLEIEVRLPSAFIATNWIGVWFDHRCDLICGLLSPVIIFPSSDTFNPL
ncbi:glucose-induced degradation protein 8-like protein isoform X1 [Sesbania bispinosa]|nr:glucose-induced degradation protein 8-like protein isoform X1 [Sesbania bispinosa]